MVDVLTVRPRMGKPLETFWTLERFLARVKSSVFGQVMLVFESLVAVAAFVRTLIWNSIFSFTIKCSTEALVRLD